MKLRFFSTLVAFGLLSSSAAHAADFYVDAGATYLDGSYAYSEGVDLNFDIPALKAEAGIELNKMFSFEAELATSVESDENQLEYGSDFSFFGISDILNNATNSNTVSNLTGLNLIADENIYRQYQIDLEYMSGLYARAKQKIGPLDIYLRGGLVQAELNVDYAIVNLDRGIRSTQASSSKTDTGFALGAGATYNLTNHIYLRGDYSRYEMDRFSGDAFTLSIGIAT